jgi:hypothetical protein
VVESGKKRRIAPELEEDDSSESDKGSNSGPNEQLEWNQELELGWEEEDGFSEPRDVEDEAREMRAKEKECSELLKVGGVEKLVREKQVVSDELIGAVMKHLKIPASAVSLEIDLREKADFGREGREKMKPPYFWSGEIMRPDAIAELLFGSNKFYGKKKIIFDTEHGGRKKNLSLLQQGLRPQQGRKHTLIYAGNCRNYLHQIQGWKCLNQR